MGLYLLLVTNLSTYIGDIYLGFDSNACDYVAIKIERINAEKPQLQHEARVYQLLQGGRGFS